MKPIFVTKSLIASATNIIAASQSPAASVVLVNGASTTGFTAAGVCASQSPGAGAITINGSLASGSIAMIPAARLLFLTSGGNDSAITFSIIGRNSVGKIIGEGVVGANVGTVNTVNRYSQVTSVTHTGTVTGTLVIGTQGEITLDTQRQISLASGGNDSGITFTISGTNDEGLSITETLTGGNVATVATIFSFFSVTGITHIGSVTGTLTVGTNTIGYTKPIPLDQHTDPFSVALFIEIAAGKTVNCTVQYTPDDVQLLANAQSATGILWTDHTNLGSKTASTDSNIAFPASAVRLKINSGTDPATLIVRQAGIWG